MIKLVNRAKMTTPTTGTGAITLGLAVDGYQTFATAGVVDSDVVRYVIEDGDSWEIGTGTYTASGTTLTRTVSESSNAGSLINLSGSAVVFVGATADDLGIEGVGGGVPFTDRAGFIAGDIPVAVTRASFFVGGNTYAVVRDATGPIVQTNGQTWAPDGDVTPQHFGAVGDGVADDTAAFVAASNAASGVVCVPSGVYVLSTFSVPVSDIVFLGHNATLKVAGGHAGSPLLVSISARGNVRFEGITFDGNESGVSSFNNVVSTFGASDVSFFNCVFQNCLGIAALISTSENVRAEQCRFINCGIRNRTTGLQADKRQAFATFQSPRATVQGCYFENVGLDCISFGTSSDDCAAIGNVIFSNDSSSIYLGGCSGFIISNNRIQNIDGANAIDVFSCDHGTVTGNLCWNNGAAGILIAACDDVTVSANVCWNNNQRGTSVHVGGITLSAEDGEVCRNVVITGNLCFDDQGAGVTQRNAIGVRRGGTGSFSKIRISKDNRLTGYAVGGAEASTAVFQNTLLGLVDHPYTFNLATGAEVFLYDAIVENVAQFVIYQQNETRFGMFQQRANQAPLELIDPSGVYETTDTGTTQAVYRNAGDNKVYLKNRTGGTRTYTVSGGASSTT